MFCSLHDEVVAQRALDRRLTSELKRFKSRITSLTRWDTQFMWGKRRIVTMLLCLVVTWLKCGNMILKSQSRRERHRIM